MNGTGGLQTDLISPERMMDAVRQANVNIDYILDILRADDLRIFLQTYENRNATLYYRTLQEAINSPNIGNETRQAIALQHLGRGLHAIQDIQAHGQIGVGPNNITGHALDTILSHFGFGPIRLAMNPDSFSYVWADHSMTALTWAFGDQATLAGNPRIFRSIFASEDFLWRFIGAVHDSSWLRCDN